MIGLGGRERSGWDREVSLRYSFFNTSLLSLPVSTCKYIEGSLDMASTSLQSQQTMNVNLFKSQLYMDNVHIPSWLNDYMRTQDLLASGGIQTIH